ncbi:stage V sporulation protein B [Oscillospiraceae bacterium]|nr:stage V sporulation protein B [Oscillospiraceae bacterium]BDF73383.1 stage V sporulation protein B [Oscillospiraceae bacterium]
MSSHQKKNTFYGAAAILTVSTILVKIIGAIYKIPLTALLPEAAYGDFNAAYNIYSFFLTISTAGLPVALSKTVSETHALGRYNQKERVFRVAFSAFLVMGLLSFVCMSVFSQVVATHVIGNEKAVFCVLALAPAVLCTCCCSAFRGYAQGHLNMVPTAISQIIEALCKLFLGLTLAIIIMRMAIQPDDLRERLSAAGALLGVSVGSILSVVFLFFNHARTKRRQALPAHDVPDSSGDILSHLLRLAIPITLSSCTMSIVTLIDTNLVNNQLQTVFTAIEGGLTGINNSVLDVFPKAVALFQDKVAGLTADPASGILPVLDSARSMYGTYSKTMSIYNLPFSLMVPLTACIVPAVSACIARRDRLGAQRVTESAMRISALIALPCGLGLFALGGPIIHLLTVGNVDTAIAGPLLSILGIASIFVCIQVVAASILQANGIVNLPIITVVIGGVVKILVNYTLVGDPRVMIIGAPVGTLCCFAVVSVLNLIIIKRSIPNPPRLGVVFFKPLIAAAVMAGAAWASHGLFARFLSGSFAKSALATLLAIVVGAAVYLIMVLVLHVISKEDLELMPKGEKIAKILHIK